MDDCCNTLPLGKKQNKIMERFIGGRKLAGKPRSRWKYAVWENSVYTIQIRN
jgi:hypothetical protein